jgi:hypothetical protein
MLQASPKYTMERIEESNSHMPPKLTPEIITAAIDGFESQKVRIDQQIAELRALLSGSPAESGSTPEPPTGKRRKFSAAARKRMKEAQQRRWAKIRAEAERSAPQEIRKPKRKLSKAGKAAIVAALKKRWALKRAETEKAQAASAKKTTRKKAAGKKAAKKASKTVAVEGAA